MTSNLEEDNIIIEKAKNGDRGALTELIKRYEKTVYNFAFKICRDKEKAENAMQETFFSIVKNLKQFSGESKLSTWIYTIASNHCLMMTRSAKKTETEDVFHSGETPFEDNIADWSETPDKIAENNELKNLLDETIKKLPQDYKIVFLLRDVEGLSTEETAKAVNLSVPAVKSRLHRARAFLRSELNKILKYE